MKTILMKRKVLNEDRCDHCHLSCEDTSHALWNCPCLSPIWDSDSMWNFQHISEFNSYGDLIKFIIETGKNLELFAVIVWTIWSRRNLLHTSDKPFPISQVLPNAIAAHADFIHTLPAALPALTSHGSSRVLWSPPPHPYFKVNFDGAVFKESNSAGIGVVIRDDLGQVMTSMSESVHLPSSVDEVEALTAVRAIYFAQEVGFSSIILEGDSERVIKSLRSEKPSFASFGHLIEDAKVLIESFVNFTVSHVKRQGNSIAHKLARHVSDFQVWMRGDPSHLNAVIVTDLAPLV